MTQYCSRCNDELDKPHEKHANYVVGTDLTEEEVREQHYVVFHTDISERRARWLADQLPNKTYEEISAEMADPDADERIEVPNGTKRVEAEDGSFVETADRREAALSYPTEEMEHMPVDDVHDALDDERAATAYTNYEKKEVQKTGLVCPECVRDDDEVIW